MRYYLINKVIFRAVIIIIETIKFIYIVRIIAYPI